jgi:hypothetical protein
MSQNYESFAETDIVVSVKIYKRTLRQLRRLCVWDNFLENDNYTTVSIRVHFFYL